VILITARRKSNFVTNIVNRKFDSIDGKSDKFHNNRNLIGEDVNASKILDYRTSTQIHVEINHEIRTDKNETLVLITPKAWKPQNVSENFKVIKRNLVEQSFS
jgi:hypothetical protein